MVGYGVWFLLAGGVGLLAGLAGAHRRRRLQASGHTAWAMVLPAPSDTAEGGVGTVSVQFALDDGRVIERVQARPVRRSAARRPGDRVLVWYDPADPSDVLVYGSGGEWSDRAFLTVGAALVVVGAVFAGLG